jgi:hypothetical protein
MAEKLQPDADGGLTITIQHDAPGEDKMANWLPAPELRLGSGRVGTAPVKRDVLARFADVLPLEDEDIDFVCRGLALRADLSGSSLRAR